MLNKPWSFKNVNFDIERRLMTQCKVPHLYEIQISSTNFQNMSKYSPLEKR
jgi:hypothetical protein